jgi:hypothetical protein
MFSISQKGVKGFVGGLIVIAGMGNGLGLKRKTMR